VASGSNGLDESALARMMFDSVQKLAELPDEVVIYPGHGAGSACGKNISSATSCTIGKQKQKNYAFKIKEKEDFVKELTSNIPPPPDYFAHNVNMNKTLDKASVNENLMKGQRVLSVDEFHNHVTDPNSIVLDCRTPPEYTQAHVPGSLFSPLKGKFAIWAANLISDSKKPIVLVCKEEFVKECITRCARTGIDTIIGYFSDLEAYKAKGFPLNGVKNMDPQELLGIYENGESSVDIVDVRNLGEYNTEHVKGAKLVSLNVLNQKFKEINPNKEVFLHCRSGTRSLVAYSFLESKGFNNICNVNKGFIGMKENQFKLESL
jgi:rhodanese-related sulfurtransferase